MHYIIQCILCIISYSVYYPLYHTVFIMHYIIQCILCIISYSVYNALYHTVCIMHYIILSQVNPSNKELQRDEQFLIKHYAGNVTYTITAFIDKNKDPVFQDFKRLLYNRLVNFIYYIYLFIYLL